MPDAGPGAVLAASAEVRLALAAGIGSMVVAVALLVIAAGVRTWRLRTARRDEQARRRWTPVFLAAVGGRVGSLPSMRRRDRVAAVEVWNRLMATVRGESRDRLRRCGAALGFSDHARRAVRRGRGRQRLGAVVALGHLGDRSAWGRLVALLDDPNSGVRIDAARALVRIDEANAVRLLVPRFLDAAHWYPAAAVSVLGEAGSDEVSLALAGAVAPASALQRRQLARILGGLRSPSALVAVRRLLGEAGGDDELVSACLDALANCGEAADAARVRSLLDHPAWFVRLKAVSALGRLGGPEDGEALSRLLCDSEWWVRYRSAQAVADVPGLGTDELTRLRRAHPDPYARDAAAQVLAERGAAA